MFRSLFTLALLVALSASASAQFQLPGVQPPCATCPQAPATPVATAIRQAVFFQPSQAFAGPQASGACSSGGGQVASRPRLFGRLFGRRCR